MKEQAFENLLEFKEILDEMGIPFFLDGGTLLGAYRDDDFCLDDEDDIDLASYAKYQKHIPEIIRRAEQKGFQLYRWWKGDTRLPDKGQEIAVIKNYGGKQLKIDFYFYEKKGRKAWTGVYDTETHLIPRVVPYENIKNLVPIYFRGTLFSAPSETEDYLTWTYGDWKTPKYKKYYSCYNPNDLRALQPEFEFWK